MEPKMIIINKDSVAEYKMVKMMNPDEFAQKIAIEKIDLGLSLPYGTVTTLYSKNVDGEKISMAVLKQKRKQVISVADRNREGGADIKMFEFNFPQLMFFIDYNLSTQTISNCHVYMLNPRTEISDIGPGQRIDLCGLPMPNLHGDHRPCMGNSNEQVISKDPKKYIENFYTGVWNSDLEDHIQRNLPQGLHTLVLGQNTLSGKIQRLNNEWMNPQANWISIAKFKMPQNPVTMNADFNVLEMV